MTSKTIRVYRLISGAEVISEIVDKEVGIDVAVPVWVNPMFLVAGQPSDGKTNVSLLSAIHFASGDTVEPNLDHILYEYQPKDNLRALYESTLTQMKVEKSGLVSPSQAEIARMSN